MPDDGGETLATTVLDAEPDVILPTPVDPPSPFLTAGFAGLLLQVGEQEGLGQDQGQHAPPPGPDPPRA